jgi:hypothetical protein
MLRHGDKKKAYRAAYNSTTVNERSIESAANRLMQNQEVADAIEEAENRMYAEAEQVLKERYVAEMLSVQRKRILLAQIAEGNWIEQPPPDHITGHPIAVMVPTLKDRLKAIDMDNRMDGSYKAKPATTEAAKDEENTDEANSQGNTERNPPTGRGGNTQPVNKPVTGAVYIAVKGNRIERPEITPRAIPSSPYLNKPVESLQRNITQQPPGWMRTVQL